MRFALVLLVACSRDESAKVSVPSPEVQGTLVVDGAPAASLQCRAGAAVHIFVDVVAREGTLRFEDQRLSWNGEPLTCAKLDRSWGGGRRPDGSAYWRGQLDVDCKAGSRTVVAQLELDCGNITPAERAQLDAQRAQTLARQRDAGT